MGEVGENLGMGQHIKGLHRFLLFILFLFSSYIHLCIYCAFDSWGKGDKWRAWLVVNDSVLVCDYFKVSYSAGLHTWGWPHRFPWRALSPIGIFKRFGVAKLAEKHGSIYFISVGKHSGAVHNHVMTKFARLLPFLLTQSLVVNAST